MNLTAGCWLLAAGCWLCADTEILDTDDEVVMMIKELRCIKTLLEFKLRKLQRELRNLKEESMQKVFSAPSQMVSKELSESIFHDRTDQTQSDDDERRPRRRKPKKGEGPDSPSDGWGLFSVFGL